MVPLYSRPTKMPINMTGMLPCWLDDMSWALDALAEAGRKVAVLAKRPFDGL